MFDKEKPNQRVRKSISGHIRKHRHKFPAIFALVLFGTASNIWAQGVGNNRPQPASTPSVIATFSKADGAATAGNKTDEKKGDKKKDDSPLSEREKTLLDRIERLEKRLAEVESRLADKSSGEKPQPAGATNAGAFRPAETPALNTTAAVPKTDVSGASQAPTEPAAAISPKFGAASASQNREKREPFAFADFTWLTGNPRT